GREGEERNAEVLLKERPGSTPSGPPKQVAMSSKDPLGCSVEDAGEPQEGVRVTSVDVRGPSYRVGVREGDVIVEVDGAKVENKDAFKAALQRPHRSGVTRLYVRRGGRPIFFGVKRDAPVTASN